MRSLSKVFLVFLGATAACSATSSRTMRGSGSTDSTGQGGGASAEPGSNGSGAGVSLMPTGSTGNSSGTCVVTDPDADMDHDGWTPNQGDCNDCDPNVNPGAIDVAPVPGPDGGVGPEIDSNCNGKFDPPLPCDTGLALDDVSPETAAEAIDLCQTTTESAPLPHKTWGVLSSQYVRADGTAYSPTLQVGIQSDWGPNVHPQRGANMLAISSGHARTSSQSGACGSSSCANEGAGTAPPHFPQDDPACQPDPDIFDDIGLELRIRTPTNVTGYSFSFKFYSMEYPWWVCDSYNDQFIALVSPPPAGSINGNISFDSMHSPVSVNLGFFDVCDPTQSYLYAFDCQMNGGTCPALPSPYCASGTSQLAGTGFDLWDKSRGGGGATSWLKSQAPVKGGTDITIRFAMWDTGDDGFDSTTLIDDFQWIATPGTSVAVATTPILQ